MPRKLPHIMQERKQNHVSGNRNVSQWTSNAQWGKFLMILSITIVGTFVGWYSLVTYEISLGEAMIITLISINFSLLIIMYLEGGKE